MAKKTSKKASPPTRRTISLKKIIAEIDKVLAKLEKTPSTTRSLAGSQNVIKAKLSLRAARAAVESVCVPGFEFPQPE